MADVSLQDLKIFEPQIVNDQSNNGGQINLTEELISGNVGVTFDDVPSDELASGSDKFRKVILACQSNNNGSTFSNHVWLHRTTPGDDWAVFYACTNDDTQDTFTRTEPYGAATLAADVSIDATSIIVNVEDASLSGIFRNGGKFIISDKEFVSSVAGNAVKRDSNGPPVVVGTQITISFDEPLGYSFSAGANVSSIFEAGSVAAAIGSIVVTSASGTFDNVTNPIVPNNKGMVDETLTLSFSNTTDFTCVGSVSGAIAETGSVGLDYSPINPITGNTICTIPAAAFGGTFANSDTITINVTGCYFSVFQNRVIPAGAQSVTANLVHLGWSCESS